MRHRRIATCLVVGVVLLGGCSAGEGPAGAGLHDEPDAGCTLALTEPLAPAPELPPDLRIECTVGFDPMICDGRCPARQGCCVTGIRPLGVCRTLDDCGPQCELDCAVAAVTYGGIAGAKCETLCTWLAPEPQCRPRP